MAEKLKVSMDMDDLTFGELEEFEDVTGMVMSDAVRSDIVRDPKTGKAIPDPDDPKGRPLKEMKMGVKAMMGLVYLAQKRVKPETTFDDIRKLKLSDVDLDVREGDGATDAENPTESE